MTVLAEFGANIAIPDGETVGPISLAFALDGGTIEASSIPILVSDPSIVISRPDLAITR